MKLWQGIVLGAIYLFLGFRLAMGLGAAALGPISEELIFRGGLTQGLCGKIPWKAGVVIPAVLFAVGHAWPMWTQVFFRRLVLVYRVPWVWYPAAYAVQWQCFPS